MTPIKLFGFAPSTYVRTARMTCVEKGVDHALVPLDFGAASHLARHPFGKMPAMDHDGFALFETLAIAIYVDGLGSGPALVPADVKARAAMMRWISVAIDYLYRDLVGSLLADAMPTGGEEAIVRDLDLLDRELSDSAFLAGAALSLADLFVVPMVAFAGAKDRRFAPAGRASLQRWLDAIMARPSFESTAK